MRLITLIASEVFGLFVDDEFLALAILAVVLASAFIAWTSLPHILAGATLLVGCVGTLSVSLARANGVKRNGGPTDQSNAPSV